MFERFLVYKSKSDSDLVSQLTSYDKSLSFSLYLSLTLSLSLYISLSLSISMALSLSIYISLCLSIFLKFPLLLKIYGIYGRLHPCLSLKTSFWMYLPKSERNKSDHFLVQQGDPEIWFWIQIFINQTEKSSHYNHCIFIHIYM